MNLKVLIVKMSFPFKNIVYIIYNEDNKEALIIDPSGDLSEGKKARTCKMGLDATIPQKGTGKGFNRQKYRKVDLSNIL